MHDRNSEHRALLLRIIAIEESHKSPSRELASMEERKRTALEIMTAAAAYIRKTHNAARRETSSETSVK